MPRRDQDSCISDLSVLVSLSETSVRLSYSNMKGGVNMAELSGITEITLVAKESKNLDTICYRGEAPFAHLAAISQADVFDQETHPEGLQRDLSPKHASEAYEYVARPADPDYPRAFPEVVLNVRDPKAVQIEDMRITTDTLAGEPVRVVRLRFDLEQLKRLRRRSIPVSRTDGNHRLWFAAGDDRRDPLLARVPFQLHIGLTREQESSLFVDINSNQKGLNTSHLAVIQNRLTEEELEIKDHLDRWIAKKLTDDPQSPWHGFVHLGGSKKGTRAQGLTRPINFASLVAGVNRTLAKSQYIHDLTDPKAQYALIRMYWQAVKMVFVDEWATPKDYLLLKNIGVLSLSILGGTIIDRCFSRGTASVSSMASYLRQAKPAFDWSRQATGDHAISGMSGNRAALIIAGEMAKQMSDENGVNQIKDIQAELIAQVTT